MCSISSLQNGAVKRDSQLSFYLRKLNFFGQRCTEKLENMNQVNPTFSEIRRQIVSFFSFKLNLMAAHQLHSCFRSTFQLFCTLSWQDFAWKRHYFLPLSNELYLKEPQYTSVGIHRHFPVSFLYLQHLNPIRTYVSDTAKMHNYTTFKNISG